MKKELKTKRKSETSRLEKDEVVRYIRIPITPVMEFSLDRLRDRSGRIGLGSWDIHYLTMLFEEAVLALVEYREAMGYNSACFPFSFTLRVNDRGERLPRRAFAADQEFKAIEAVLTEVKGAAK